MRKTDEEVRAAAKALAAALDQHGDDLAMQVGNSEVALFQLVLDEHERLRERVGQLDIWIAALGVLVLVELLCIVAVLTQ